MQPVTYRVSKYNEHIYGAAVLSGMLCFSFLVALGAGLWWLGIPQIASAVGYLDEKMHFLWPWLALTMAAAPAFALHVLWKSPNRNFLVLDDTGLTHVRLGLRRNWPWRDLQATEVRTHPLGKQTARITVSGKFGWTARIAMLLIGRLASSDRMTVTLPNYYETSIEDVIETLNDYRDRVLGIERPVETAGGGMNIAKQDPYATVYRMTRYKLYTKKNDSLMTLLLLVVFSGLFVTEMSAIDLSILAVILAVTISMAVCRIRHGSQDDNFLQLGDDDVTFVSWGKVRNWRWSDLPAFEIRDRSKFWSAAPRRIVIGKRAEGWTRFRPRPAIRDDYDAPLDGIAATLNAYRERALGDVAG